jgi:transposase
VRERTSEEKKAVIKIEFSESEIAQIRYERYHHPHPRVQQKMEALLLKSEGLPHQEIARIVGICENTLRSYLKDYQAHGIEKLKEVHFYRPSSQLEAHRGTLENYFNEHPVTTIAEAVSKIEEITEIKRSPGRVSHFLKSLGTKRRK